MRISKHQRPDETGSVLIVTLIFLILFGLMAATVFRGSLSSVLAIGNMQWRIEAINAANDAIDKLISDPGTFSDPVTTAAFVKGTPFSFDVTGDGNSDVTVRFLDESVGPKCKGAVAIPTSALDPAKVEDLSCMASDSSANTGLSVTDGGATSSVAGNASLCSNAVWSLSVQATDAVTNTTVRVEQGIGVRVPTTTADSCN